MGGGGGISVQQVNERMEMVKAFDETQAGVKGLTDSGIQKVPKIFVRSSEELAAESNHQFDEKVDVQVPLVDLSGILNPERREHIIREIRIASETWGFFHVVNHGIPLNVIDEMIEGVRKFNELDLEEKRKFYSRDEMRNVRFNSNYDLFTSRTARWRDTLMVSFPNPDLNVCDELPLCCRDSTSEYSKHVRALGDILLGLLSEALGLETDYLKNMECFMAHRLHCHYYPACPEPKLTLGTTKHSDAEFLTILAQSLTITGLQVLNHGKWVNIHPIPGGLIVNIGDLLQLVTNGRFKSCEHRAVSNQVGPRISVACFFAGPINQERMYGPIPKLISDEKVPIYREVVFRDYVAKFLTQGLDDYHGLEYYKL